MPYHPHISIINHLNNGTFGLAQNELYAKNGQSYGQQEFTRCKELFKNKLPDEYKLGEDGLLKRCLNLFQNAYVITTRIEKRLKPQLERLAINTIKEIYDVPEHLVLQAKLKSGIEDIDFDAQQEDIEEPAPDRIKYVEREIQKRIILNGLVHGSSMHVWKSCHYIVRDKLNELDDRLMSLYDRYIAIVSFQLWKNELVYFTTQGINKIEFEKQDRPNASIKSEAINFPVLLHEVNKGVIDYLICRAIPKDLTKKELKYYYAKADDYNSEVFHYLLSPTLWKTLLDAIQMPTQNISEVIARLSLLEYEELVELFDVLNNKKDKTEIILKKYEIR